MWRPSLSWARQVTQGANKPCEEARYAQTLMDAVSPCSFMKRKFSTTRLRLGHYRRILNGIESRIKNLHSLGLVHNDISPSNIMLDGNAWMIIDSGSQGRKLG